MKRIYLAISLLTLAVSAQTQASEQEARVYCENGAKLMQLEGEKAAEYIAECIKDRLEEEAEE